MPLLAILILGGLFAALTEPASSVTLSAAFSLQFARSCLKPDFLLEEDINQVGSLLHCSLDCLLQGGNCHGFRITDDGNSSTCQTMEFNRCSHALNKADCDAFNWVYVRSLDGLPSGQLCPAGYGNGFRGSVYKMIGVSSWTEGLKRCNSLPGLTKFADGIDKSEVEFFHTLKPTLNGDLGYSMRSFYLGGFRPSPSSSGPWFWHDCSTGLLPEVWGVDQPNEGDRNDRTNIWYSHTFGVDDELASATYLIRALCECVNPFV